jgi:hypothetical protein
MNDLNDQVVLRLSKTDKSELKKLAQKERLSLSAFVRSKIFCKMYEQELD